MGKKNRKTVHFDGVGEEIRNRKINAQQHRKRISSSLNSNVAQRTEFFGMLRCLGATKKQIMRFVRFNEVDKPGMVWGYAAFWVSWISIVASTLLGALTVLLAARSPAKRAAKVSPLIVVSGNARQTVFSARW